MKNGWKTARIGDVIVENPKSQLKVRDSISGGAYPFYTSGVSINSCDDFLCDGENLFIATGGKACVQYYAGKAAYSTDCYSLTTRAHVTPKFLFYFLDSILAEIEEHMFEGAALRHLQKKKFKEIVTPLPTQAEQQRIVGILDKAFAGVATAKANAEQNLRNARALFESHLYSEHAERALLGDLVEIKTGKLDANAAVEGGQYPFFTCSREVFAIDKYAFDCEAILLAGNNAVGDFNVKHYKGKFNAYQRTYVITVNARKRVLYRFLYFQMLKSLKKFKAQSVGAGTKFLKLGMIKDLEIALPGLAEQQRIVATMDSVREETQRLETIYRQKLAALEELKKALLHRAFAGEL